MSGMSELLRDLRFGARLLLRSPVFAATCILLLGIGISANTLIFSVVDALLLKTLPVSRPQDLVRIVEVHPNDFVTWDLAYGLHQSLAAGTSTISEVLCQSDLDVLFSDGPVVERVRVDMVSS